MSSTLAAKAGSLECLKVRSRYGWSRWHRQMCCRARGLMPTALATARPVKCVTMPGGSEHGQRQHLGHSGGRPGLWVLSRNSLSMPCSALRTCLRQTAGWLTPARRATSRTGRRAAESIVMFARCTCFCGRFQSLRIAAERAVLRSNNDADGLGHTDRGARRRLVVNPMSASMQ